MKTKDKTTVPNFNIVLESIIHIVIYALILWLISLCANRYELLWIICYYRINNNIYIK